MDLNSYLTWKDGRVSREGTECRKLAAKARTTPYYVYMLALGHKSPSLGLAQRIASATRDAVSVADWPRQQAA